MKRVTRLVLALTLMAGVAFGVNYLTTGFGSRMVATTASSRLDGFSARSVSIYNPSSTAVIYALVNCTTNEFDVRQAAGTTMSIPAGKDYTFDTGGDTSIHSLCIQASAGTVTNHVNCY